MPRSRRSSALTDLLEIASQLPWKISLGLSAISLLVLHLFAGSLTSVPTVTNPADLGGAVVHQMIHSFAFFLQFVVPPAFLIGAAVSYFKRSRSTRLLEETRRPQGPAVASLTWQEFESLVAEGFRQRGFTVTEKGGAHPAARGGLESAPADRSRGTYPHHLHSSADTFPPS